jgi:hypothetical protein
VRVVFKRHLPSSRGARIRLATPADAPAMARVLADAFAVFEPLYTPGAFAATTPSAEAIGERFSEGPMWVAEQAGAIVGTASAVAKGTGLICAQCGGAAGGEGAAGGPGANTAPGVGAGVAAVEAYAVAQGCQRMLLSTAPVLTSAIRMYAVLGFERSDEGPRDLHGTPLFTMVKVLAAGHSAGPAPGRVPRR